MICRLCLKDLPLANSHILPSSYIKSIKNSLSKRSPAAQLLHVKTSTTDQPTTINFNPTEKLLCFNCEAIFKENYEDYGTVYLRTKKNVVTRQNYIILNNYRFKALYLYYLSILWRASITKNEFFKAVDLQLLEEPLRQCLLNNQLRFILDGNDLPIENFIIVSVAKLTATDIQQHALDNVYINFWSKRETNHYLIGVLMNGFLINFFIPFTLKITSPGKFHGILKERNTIRIPKIDYREIVSVFNAIKSAHDKQAIAEILKGS